MGLFEFLRSYFPANHIERLGPNDLPSNVLDDLRNGGQNNPLHHSDSQDQMSSIFNKDEMQGNFHHPSFHDVEKEFEDAFYQMDNMFKSFFSGFGGFHGGPMSEDDQEGNDVFRGFFGNSPHIEYFQGGPSIDLNGEGKSLRQKMLDENTEDQITVSPFQKEDDHSGRFMFKFHSPFFGNRHLHGDMKGDEDRDLDKEFEGGEKSIDDILTVPNHPNDKFVERSPSPSFSSVFKSTSVTKKINSDGSIETTSRRRDSDGNEEVVTSRILGDQTHTVTVKKNNAGEEEKIENLINMDENDLKEFNEKWNERPENTQSDRMMVPGHHTNSIIDNLPDVFSTWFKPKL